VDITPGQKIALKELTEALGVDEIDISKLTEPAVRQKIAELKAKERAKERKTRDEWTKEIVAMGIVPGAIVRYRGRIPRLKGQEGVVVRLYFREAGNRPDIHVRFGKERSVTAVSSNSLEVIAE